MARKELLIEKEDISLIKHWFEHIAQIADDRKTLTGKVMKDSYALDEIKSIAKNSIYYIEHHVHTKEVLKQTMDYKEKYEKALERARALKENTDGISAKDVSACFEHIFPELKESGGDNWIPKEIIKYLKEKGDFRSCWLAWLEKQGKQNNNEDEAILHRFSFYSYKDEPNILYLSGLYVNEEYRNKGIGTKILKIADEVAVSMKCNSILLKTEIGSNAERLYKNNGYSIFRREENQVWLEKQGEYKEDAIRYKIAEYLKKLILDQSQRGAHMLDYEGRIEEEVDFIINIAKKELKQDEQKSFDKVEPRFKQDDWVVWNDKCYKVNYNGCGYELIDQNGLHTSLEYGTVDKDAHIFGIADAKKGDVLVHNGCTFILMGIKNGVVNALEENLIDGVNPVCFGESDKDGNYYPATKEQRDLLFQKMKEAGYEWDVEKKELRKIERNPIEPDDLIEESYQQQADDLIDMVTENSAWSEEDNMHLTNAILAAEKEWGVESCTSKWLKSIKDRVQPQPHWKPSEEQLDNLLNACNRAYLTSGPLQSLRKLYEQLKQL